MPDRLAVIQSEETIKELSLIEKEVEKLVADFKELYAETDKITKAFGSGKPKDFAKAIGEMDSAVTRLTTIQKEVARVGENVNKIERESIRIAKEKANAVAAEERAKAASIRTQSAELTLKQKIENLSKKEQAQLAAAASLYKKVEQGLSSLRARYNELAIQKEMGVQLSDKEQKRMNNLERAVQKYDMALKAVDAAGGKFNRNVGNYQSGLWGMSNSVAQITREMPAFANSVQTGFMALSNNIPILFDAINNAREVNKELQAQGKPTTSVLKQIGSALFSFNTLLSVGVVLLTVYGDDLVAWATKMIRGTDAVDNATEAFEKNSDAIKAMTSEHAKNLLSLTQLSEQYKKLGDSLPEKTKFINENKNAFRDLGFEVNTVADAEKLLVENTPDVIQAMYLRAKASAYGKVATKAMEEYLQKEMELNKQLEKNYDYGNFYAKTMGALGFGVESKVKELNGLQKQVAEAKKIENSLNVQSRELLKKSGVKTYDKSDEADRKRQEAARNKRLRQLEAEEKKRLREAEEARKKAFASEQDAIEKRYQLRLNEVQNNIELAKIDPYATESDKNQRQKEGYDDLIKINTEYYAALIDNAKNYNETQKILDFERDRDTKNADFDSDRLKVMQEAANAAKQDWEYTNQIADNLREATTQEERLKILQKSKIPQKEREYILSLMELEAQKEAVKIEKNRLLYRKDILDAQQLNGKLTREEALELAEINRQYAELAVTTQELKDKIEGLKFSKITEALDPLANFVRDNLSDLGLNRVADQFTALYEKLKKEGKDFTMSTSDYIKAGLSLVADFASRAVAAGTQKQIAALDEQLRASQQNTDQEISFIEGRIEWMNNLGDLSAEQLQERQALEDEARVLREQQQQREKQIAQQKARAQQRAQANQAIINGLLAATQTLATLGIPAGILPAAVAAGMGAMMAGLIMAKDPVPQYFKGRETGPAEWAWTQEKGREIITDKHGNIKDFGSDGGARMTWLAAGDKVLTAEQTKNFIKDLPDIDYQRLASDSMRLPSVVITQTDNSGRIISGVGNEFERVMRKYDKVAYFEDEKGNVFSQSGGQYPIYRGKKKKNVISIKSDRYGRD